MNLYHLPIAMKFQIEHTIEPVACEQLGAVPIFVKIVSRVFMNFQDFYEFYQIGGKS